MKLKLDSMILYLEKVRKDGYRTIERVRLLDNRMLLPKLRKAKIPGPDGAWDGDIARAWDEDIDKLCGIWAFWASVELAMCSGNLRYIVQSPSNLAFSPFRFLLILKLMYQCKNSARTKLVKSRLMKIGEAATIF